MRRRLLVASLALASLGVLTTPLVANAAPALTQVASAAPVQPRGTVTLKVDYQVQETGYWCGPAATRIALSARVGPPSQATLAEQLGTTQNGTDWIGQVTGVLNQNLGNGYYETKEMPNDPPSQQQKELLWNDIVLDINNNYPIVANIVAPPGNQPPGYPPDQTIYHYFTIIGYDDVNRTVQIADPASFSGNQIYWLTFDQLASLIPPKGYSA
ncbi:peptidase C39-like protein [Herbihabitans rhizosphaerae]|uniref:Peptidase C39-like protein n=1 Tax=Herbihabitans rhizosphaerae TaxID=1872711 RepID=A0A4Q7KG68_9PSEU|nr:C39 family peptidase [Herbihabitans rhizosphaerae]RZS31132.1 peptidase C39-like protein [Herbihabitans rhizosphaerae]